MSTQNELYAHVGGAKTDSSLHVGEKANWEQRWPILSDNLATTVADVYTSEKDAKIFAASPRLLSAMRELLNARDSYEQTELDAYHFVWKHESLWAACYEAMAEAEEVKP